MSQITKLSGLATACLIALFTAACTEKSSKTSSQDSAIEQNETHAALRNEIEKLLREEKHDPEILKESLRGMTWENVRLVFDDSKEKLDRASPQQISDAARIRTIARLKITFNSLDIEESQKRGDQALKELERGLGGMAEKEGKEPK